MKRIGILGGTSPESTVDYYRRLTRSYVERFGDHGYPEILIYSVTFQRYMDWMAAGDWDALAAGVRGGLNALGGAGAQIGLMATNTFHKVFDDVASASPFPLISILDVVAERLKALGASKAALLGTRSTMTGTFYPQRLSRDGIGVLTPDEAEQGLVDRIIFEELTQGVVTAPAKAELLETALALIARGADAVILGCTELPLLVSENDLPVPILNTTHLHADALLEAAIG